MTKKIDNPDDADIIAQAIQDRRESVDYFSPARKTERELWVANEFLANLELAFEPSEVIAAADDPPDVHFRDARFEIKEILDPGRRRHDEYRQSLTRAQLATTASELYELVEPHDVTDAEICDRVRDAVDSLQRKYPLAVRATLDVLFYVNLDNMFGYIQSDLPSNSSWTPYGFRSVCFVSGRLAGVVHYSEGSPSVLRAGGVRVIRSSRRVT